MRSGPGARSGEPGAGACSTALRRARPAGDGSRRPRGRRSALGEVTHARPPWRIDSVMVSEGTNTRSWRRSRLRRRSPSCCAFTSRACPGSRKRAGGGADVGPLRHAAARHRAHALQDHDVYVTDWLNVRDVPLAAGRFGLDEYIEHVMQFTAALGPGGNVLAVCQPTVAALAAVGADVRGRAPGTPASLTLMAGPIDCRISPTGVNQLATSKPIEWFEKNLISPVPWQLTARGPPRLSGLRAAVGVHQHEPRAPRERVPQVLRPPAAGEQAAAKSIARLLRGVPGGRRPRGRLLPRDRAPRCSRNSRCRTAS